MTIFVTWQSRVTLYNIWNSCDVLNDGLPYIRLINNFHGHHQAFSPLYQHLLLERSRKTVFGGKAAGGSWSPPPEQLTDTLLDDIQSCWQYGCSKSWQYGCSDIKGITIQLERIWCFPESGNVVIEGNLNCLCWKIGRRNIKVSYSFLKTSFKSTLRNGKSNDVHLEA